MNTKRLGCDVPESQMCTVLSQCACFIPLFPPDRHISDFAAIPGTSCFDDRGSLVEGLADSERSWLPLVCQLRGLCYVVGGRTRR